MGALASGFERFGKIVEGGIRNGHFMPDEERNYQEFAERVYKMRLDLLALLRRLPRAEE
jgi:hypothetical protein